MAWEDFVVNGKWWHYGEWQSNEKKQQLWDHKKWCYREFDVISMTLYGVIFYKDKEREKSEPTKKWCYSEFDAIGSDVIGSFDCSL